MIVEAVVAAVIVAGFLAGIRLMQSPETALWGNRLGALGMAAAVAFTLNLLGAWRNPVLWLLLAAGMLAGFTLGERVKMIQMPQMVALLNGLGGAASAGVAGAAAILAGGEAPPATWLTVSLALSIGLVTFSGSMVAALKLSGIAPSAPLLFPAHRLLMPALAAAGALLILLAISYSPLLYALIPVFAVYGIIMTLRIGGADMPIVISLLNSMSGLAAAVSGLAVENLMLTGTGAIVGVAGMILTRLMCRAMNRNLPAVLAGFKAARIAKSAEEQAEEAPEREAGDPLERVAAAVAEAQSVIIVPGYGMAVAQAQHRVKELVDALEEAGKEVKIAIHPVAGRMPGHMNVLLAEAGIPYEKLQDLEEINPAFAKTDLVIAVGACDVINPAANTAEGTPIYGMPILEVSRARHVVVCNLDGKPGYSGVENTLYGADNVTALWGSAAETVPRVTEKVRKAR